MAFFPESSHKTLPLLRSIVFQDPEDVPVPEGLLATAIVSFVLLFANSPTLGTADNNPTVVEEKLRQFLAHQSPSIRWVDATSLTHLSIIDPPIITTLASTIITSPPKTAPRILFYLGSLEEYAMASLEAACQVRPIPEPTLQSVLTSLLDLLSNPSSSWCTTTNISTCCEILWSDPQTGPFNQSPPITFENLHSDEERRLIRGLAE